MTAPRRRRVGLLYTAPALLFVGAFVLYPLVQLFRMSLTSASLLGANEFVGLKNYLRALQDETFWDALLFTAKYTVYITPILIIVGFALALLTSGPSWTAKITRAVVFLPVVIGIGSSSFLWLGLLDEQVGLANKFLQDLALIREPIVWFVDAELGLWAVIISIVWKVLGFGMILFVSSIQSVETDLLHASMIDGAGYWQRVVKVILPLSYRTIVLTTLISAIGSMLAFEQFYIMTGGGPRSETFTSVYWIYQNSFIYFKQGYGATLSILLLAIIFVASIVHLLLARRWDTL
jgi:multiple sugar transport system permease protein